MLYEGVLLPARTAVLPLDDRVATLGDAVFTTLGVRRGVAWRLGAHRQRLTRDVTAVLGLEVSAATALVARAFDGSGLNELLAANGLLQRDAALRICVSAGSAPRGLARPETLQPRWWATAAPATLGPRLVPGVRVATVAAPWLDGLAEAGLTQAKHASRLPWVLASQQRTAAGSEVDEVLLCNAAGEVVCASVHNVFALDGDGHTLRTPSVAAGALPGIARAAVLEQATREGLTVVEAPIPLGTLREAPAVWLTNSLDRMAVVRTLDGSTLPQRGGALVQRLAAALDDE